MENEYIKKKEFMLSHGYEALIADDLEPTLFKYKNMVESISGISYNDLVNKIGGYIDVDKNENVAKEEPVNEDKKDGELISENQEDKFAELEESPFEEVEIESDQYVYLAEELKKVPLPILRRISYNGNRFYFETKESGEIVLYSSGTTLIANGYVSTSDGLSQWKLKQRILGNDPDAIAAERADLGTIMHVLFGHLLLGYKVPFSVGGVKHYVSKIDDLKIEKDRVKYIVGKYAVELLEDMRSLLKWIKDYNVKPIAIELMLRSEKYQVASAIDFICQIDYKVKERGFFGRVYQRASGDKKKGDPMEEEREVVKQMIIIVDFKSNRDGNFYPEYLLQLELYRRMVEENFGDMINIEGLYNFAPKTWGDGKKPYHFRSRTDSQTDQRELMKADCVFEQGKLNHMFKNPMITCYVGTAHTGEDFDLERCIRTIPLVDYLSDPINSWKQEDIKSIQ